MSELFEKKAQLEKDYMENVVSVLIPGTTNNILNFPDLDISRRIFSVEISNNFSVDTPYDPHTSRFVHFTSIRALQSILKENAIRLYSLDNANNPSEFDYYIKDIPHERIGTPDWIKSNTFILSLCDSNVLESENILNLWRLYGDGGWGVAVEFEITVSQTGVCNYFLGKLNYHLPDRDQFFVKNSEFENRHNVKVDCSQILRVPACFHKNPYYKIEEEVRLMLFDDYLAIKAREKPEEYDYMKEFNSHHNLVAYTWLKLGKNQGHRLPHISIKRIQLGFRHSKEAYADFHIHMEDTIASLSRVGTWKDAMPKIEPSPLENIYR